MNIIKRAATAVFAMATAEAKDIAREAGQSDADVEPMAVNLALDIAHEVASQARHGTRPSGAARRHLEAAIRDLRWAAEANSKARGWPHDYDAESREWEGTARPCLRHERPHCRQCNQP